MFRQAVSWRQMTALKSTYRFMNAVVAPSKGAGASIKRIAGVRDDRLSIIPNLLKSDVIGRLSQEPLPAWAAEIYLKPTVLGVGRLAHEKGFDLLIRAHAKLRSEGVDHNLMIIGKGPLLHSLRNLAQSLNVADSVFFPGFQRNPYAFMKSAALACLSSRFEGFSLAIAEALTCGTPVVAADCPSGPAEILDQGRYGELVESESADALADGIGRLLKHSARRAELSASGIHRSQAYSAQTVIGYWERLLRTVAAHSGVSPAMVCHKSACPPLKGRSS
jgi:glycosyltransferase involved in cell wall biosynthesis